VKGRRGAWPYGLPTKVCSACNGTGASRSALADAMAGRSSGKPYVHMCDKCGGRGRLIDAGATCRHNLVVNECALCKREL
jgi:DnaJ-class molecular chaperone